MWDPQAELALPAAGLLLPAAPIRGWTGARGCAACPACTLPRSRTLQGRQSGAVCQGQVGDGHHHADLSGGLHLSLQALLPHRAWQEQSTVPALCPARPAVCSSSTHPKSPKAKRTRSPGTGTPLQAQAAPKEMAVTGDQGSTSSHSLKCSHLPPAPPKPGDRAGTARALRPAPLQAPRQPARLARVDLYKEKGRGEGQGRINISLALQKHQREIMV